FLDDAAQLDGRALPKLGEIAMESVDFGTKLVALLGGGTDDREPLESIAELLLKPLVLGVELISLAGVPFVLLSEAALVLGGRRPRLGKGGVEPLELGRDLVTLLPQPRELLLALAPRFGEGGLKPLDFCGCALVLFPQPGEILLVLDLRF